MQDKSHKVKRKVPIRSSTQRNSAGITVEKKSSEERGVEESEKEREERESRML